MDLKNPRFLWSPGAVVLLKIGSSQPDTLFTGKHLQSMSIDGPGTLQSSMCHTLKHKRPFYLNSDFNGRHSKKYPLADSDA